MPSSPRSGDDVGGAELEAEVGAGLVAAHEDDVAGPEELGRDHRAQAHGTVTDDGDRLPGLHAGNLRGVVAGRHDVGEAGSDGTSASSNPAGTVTSMPEACGTLTFSP